MKCSNCGNELEAGSRFCGSCGSPVNVPGPLSFDPPPAYIQSPAAGRKAAGSCLLSLEAF